MLRNTVFALSFLINLRLKHVSSEKTGIRPKEKDNDITE